MVGHSESEGQRFGINHASIPHGKDIPGHSQAQVKLGCFISLAVTNLLPNMEVFVTLTHPSQGRWKVMVRDSRLSECQGHLNLKVRLS